MGNANYPAFPKDIAGFPPTFGRVFYVDYVYGSDDYDGLSAEWPVKTLSKAYSLCTTNMNDYILINGTSAVVETAQITWSKNRIHVFGCNGFPPGQGYGAGARVQYSGTADSASDIANIVVTGVRNTFTGIKFDNGVTTATCLYCVVEAGEYNRYNNCEFYKSSLLTTAGTAEVVMNGDSSQFYNCTFGDLVNERGASGKQRANVLLTRDIVTGKACRDGAFVDCVFLHKAAHADATFIYGAGATSVERRLLIVRPVFWNAILGTADPTDCVDFSAAQTDGQVLIVNPAFIGATYVGGADLGIYIVGAGGTDNSTGKAVACSTP